MEIISPTTKELFSAARRAKKHIYKLRKEIAHHKDVLADLQRQQDEAYDLIAEASVVLHGEDGRGGLITIVPREVIETIEAYYLDVMDLRSASSIMGCSPSHAWKAMTRAFSIADERGMDEAHKREYLDKTNRAQDGAQ